MDNNNQIIAASIQVDTGNSGANVANLNKETSALKGNLKDVGATAAGTGKNISDTGDHFGKLKDKIGALPGPMGELKEKTGLVNEAFNLLKANPLVAVLALIAGLVVALFEKFKHMEAVSDSLGEAWGMLSTLFSTFLNKVLTPLIDGFVKVIGLFEKAATFITGIFSPSLAQAAKRGGELAAALDDLEKAEMKSAIARAESNRKLQEAREIAQDANVPIKERIQALKDAAKIETEEAQKSIQIATERAKIMLEQIALELGARDELVQAIRNGSMEQLKAARNEIMAMKNVDKEKLQAIDALIIQAEDQGASLARINKKTNTQITSLEKEEQSKQKEQRDRAIAAQKEAEQKLQEFRTKLRQINQDNDLAQIKDGYQKELKALEQKLQNEKDANAEAVKTGKLTKQQAFELDAALTTQYNLKVKEATDKHNKEVEQKETEFQTKLAKLKQEIALGGIVDQRDLEREQLKISHENELAEAEKLYAKDTDKLLEIRLAIDEKYYQEKRKQDEKFAEEDRKKELDKKKKAFEDSLKTQDGIVGDPTASIQAKRAALDAEQKLYEDAYAQKMITDDQYLDFKKKHTAAEKALDKEVADHKAELVTMTSQALGNLSTIAGKQTAVGKALGIAQTTIDTYQSAISAYKSLSGVPVVGPALGAIAAAAAIKNGIDAVKRITAVQIPGGGGGSSVSTPNLSPAAPVSPTVNTTKIDADSINNIGNAAAGGVNRPMRAYVVNSDVQNDAEREKRLARAATLGGG